MTTESFVAKPREFANPETGNAVYVNYTFSEQLKMYKSHIVWGYLTVFETSDITIFCSN